MCPSATNTSLSRRCGKAAWAALVLCATCGAQTLEHRGFVQTDVSAYPQTGVNDSAHFVAESLLRYEVFYKPVPSLRFAGALDARADTHRQVERRLHLAWLDRETRRPAFAARRLSATYTRDKLTVEVGRQFIRWGKADILNPTDRFAPRDYLAVVDNEFMGVTAARLTYGGQSDTLDLVWAPLFTPSRVPLLNQRWVTVPGLHDRGADYPRRRQLGARWNHVGRIGEFSVSAYDGVNHLPLFRVEPGPGIGLRRVYPRMRMFGGDAAVPLRAFTIKGEAAWFGSSDPGADEYGLYVIQLERQTGEWLLVGGYAGEAVTRRRSPSDFAPDRGLTRAFVGRAGYTIDSRRTVAMETAIRHNAKGLWMKMEYSQGLGQHWRAIAALVLIRGAENDFLGQYRRNSHALLVLRYSF